METPTLPGYAVLRALGSGQFGDVFLVQRTRDAQVFAAKIPRGVGGDNGDADAREALLLQRLQHPNVVRCEEIVCVDGGRRLAIVMEHAAMGDLEAYIEGFVQRKAAIPEDEIMRIFLQVALALAYLHDQRVLHRDLKPKNVLLGAHGVVKLSDFGVSRSLQHTLDAAQTVTGTPYYMSPELMDNQPYDGKTDVWSLGCILFELATLAPPFAAKALAALVMQIVSHPPPMLPQTYSRELDFLVKKLLTKDPSRRPTIQEVLAEPFVQRHLWRLASVASMCPETRGNQLQDKCELSRVLSTPYSAQDPSAANPIHPPQSQPPPAFTPAGVAPRVQAAPPEGEIELRRKMFFENQAAAQRNKDRVALERAAPPAFLHHEVSRQEAERPPSSAIPVQPTSQKKMEAERERARQFYLENARAAKLNKQRALEAMKGQANETLIAPGDPDDSGSGNVAPPPAPPRRVVMNTGKDYEALLEEERRRVRLERKLLYERMRDQQTSGVTESPELTTAMESPS